MTRYRPLWSDCETPSRHWNRPRRARPDCCVRSYETGRPTMIRRRHLLAATAGVLAAPAVLCAQTVQKLTFYYPVAVGGPLTAIVDALCNEYRKQTGIAVEAVYAGDYSQTLIKTTTAIRGGEGPHFAVLLAAEMHSLQDLEILVSLDEIGLDAGAKKWLDGFYPAFLANSHADN